ncbi:hypothetical protein PRZ48_012114 [Zasmidium cellare]|uniref:RTA1-domain-containing protein n=1 Tax=Zasmidium cellare TaxID=395010 RepID=A0ABR0E4E4_ZASCE|nr:hypothetical protein PRZ48_012114 [Zasmidium cellare]
MSPDQDAATLPNGFTNFRLYAYTPSIFAAITFTALFLFATAWHLRQVLRTKTYSMLPFCLGGLFEASGYLCRILSWSEAPSYSLTPYVLQTTVLLVAPALLAASVYMNLEKIVLLADGEPFLVVRREWLTLIFVAGDMMAFVLQGTGGSLIASQTPPLITTGKNLALAGLILQSTYTFLFVLTAALFHIRVPAANKRHMVGLYIVSSIIFARSIVRIVEFAEGFEGFLIRHEVFLYVFDGLLMFGAMVILGAIPPSEVIGEIRARRKAEKLGEVKEEVVVVEKGEGV